MTDPVEERLVVDRVQLCGRLAATIGGQTIVPVTKLPE
jgi:hypothetical protein